MSKNGWTACFIAAIILLFACISCFILSLVGITGYLSISPFVRSSGLSTTDGPATSTPFVFRPTPPGLPATQNSPSNASPLQDGIATVVPQDSATQALLLTGTLQTLQDTFIPTNNPYDLAQRLLGLQGISPTHTSPEAYYSVGAKRSFWVGNNDNNNFQIQATLQYVTEHAYFWVEDGVRYQDRHLSALADAFENKIYPTDRAYFGSEWTPGIDGDPHIYILYVRGIGDENAGYFSSADEYPPQVNHYSNGHEMFLVNADNAPLDETYTLGILAHEFQHMIQWYQDQNEASWINEGFSELAVLLNDYYFGGFDALYTAEPDLQLNNWPNDSQEDATAHYGASFLFATYFLDRFGEAALKSLVINPDNDMMGVDSTLRSINAIDSLTGKPVTADDFFQDWAITNYLMDSRVADGRYAYTSYQGTPNAAATESVYSCPIDPITREVNQYGVDYIRFNCRGSYTIHFEGSFLTPLLPQDPHSGYFNFWSNKNDESDSMLTRTFDLTSYTGPLTLSYWTWYDIEKGWDYAYLEASTDGERWQMLKTPSGTSADPQGNSYGWGYTGASGGGHSPTWIQETVDLSSFSGQMLTLRFEYITDANVTGEGFLLDDISIPEINYNSDFELDDGGWKADGFTRVQNMLPQTYKLALISQGRSTSVQYITLNPDISADIPFTIETGVDDVVLVVSGTTRFTRQVAPYRFSVNQP
jgi:immune inhibitor A